MKMRLTPPPSPEPRPVDLPDADELAMLRAWYAGMTVRQAVERYLPECIRAVGTRRTRRSSPAAGQGRAAGQPAGSRHGSCAP